MSQTVSEATAVDPGAIAPDTGKPMPGIHKARFMAGFIIFNILWVMGGAAGSGVLLPARFSTLDIGLAPEAILASMNSISIVFALISNLVFGALSDATRSRFGKRTPWIVPGGLVTALGFWLTSTADSLFTIVAFWSVLQIGLNLMIAPCVAILSDRIPENIRGTMSAFYGVGQTVGGALGAILGAAFITNQTTGFILATIILAVTGLVTVVIMPREQSSLNAEVEKVSVKEMVMRFRPPIKGARDFYLALVGRLLLILGYYMIYGYQLYICQKYIGLSTTEAAATISIMSTITMVCSLASALVSGPISDKIGKRKMPVVVSSVVMCIALAVPWLAPSKTSMLIFAAVMALGYGVYTAVDQALNVDVLPSPEEAGKDLGILNLANTAGQIIAPLVTSAIVLTTGSYALAFPGAIISILLGAVFIMFIKKTK